MSFFCRLSDLSLPHEDEAKRQWNDTVRDSVQSAIR
jgi:hypothetical protein